MSRSDTFLDMQPPKSPKRFFSSPFSPAKSTTPLPPLPPMPTMPLPSPPPSNCSSRKSHTPSSSTSSTCRGLGAGAEVVRTPSEALRHVRQGDLKTRRRLTPSPSMDEMWQTPPVPALRHQKSDIRPSGNGQAHQRPQSPPYLSQGASLSLEVKRLHHQSLSASPRVGDNLTRMSTFDPFGPTRMQYRRSTIRPITRSSTRPFAASIISKTTKPCPTADSAVLIILQFGFSLEQAPNTTALTMPWTVLQPTGGHLVKLIDEGLREEVPRPELTDGSSAEDSDAELDYDLNNLLRDEYLKSLWISSPSQLEFTIPPIPVRPKMTLPLQPAKKRAATRNQYTQMQPYPSPLSPFISATTPLRIRRKGPGLKVEAQEFDGGGTVTSLTILLNRDATCYHVIAARLATDRWPKMESSKRKRVEDEVHWLGMRELEMELSEMKQKVLRGGEGYF